MLSFAKLCTVTTYNASWEKCLHFKGLTAVSLLIPQVTFHVSQGNVRLCPTSPGKATFPNVARSINNTPF